MKRNNLVFRLASHIGQKLSSKAETQLKNFLKDIITKRNNLGIFEDIERLVNVDESPIYLEMPPKKTIEIKGSKNVDIYTFGKEKYRITSVLSITASGSKLLPLIIFKGKAGKYLEKKLNKLEEAKNKEIFISCQENSWCTYQLFLFWLRNIFHYYQQFVIKKKCLLVLDMASSHIHPKVIEYLNDNDIDFVVIPPGFTRYLQPLDIYVNKEFKSNLKNKYINHLTHNNLFIKNEEFSVEKELMIQWVLEIWNSNDIIEKDTINKVFKKAGISNKLDGSEDDLFIYPDEIINTNKSKDNYSEELINDIEENDSNNSNSDSEDDPYFASDIDSDGK